jgi:hypothetical protein
MALAESISGQQLDELFQTWLFTPEKPELEEVAAAATADATAMELAQVSGAVGEPVDHRGAKR